MVEGTPPASPTPSGESPATPPAEPTEAQVDEVVEEPPRTPEEIEAFWKNRIAGKDRAHNAETATLRQQIEQERQARQALEQQRTQANEAQMTEAEQWKAKAEEAERRAEAAERQRVLDVRSTKYAAAAEHLDEGTLAGMDEAKLAALNARLTGGEASPPPIVDPNTPRRQPSTPAEPREKTTAELEADLKKFEPEFQTTLNG